jgi:putative ABC transport system permease protein
MDATNLNERIMQIKAIYERLFPGEPFSYSFADDVFDKQYRTEQKLGNVFMASACAAIFIAALGLFGLAAFAARQKVKEIGIRKVLGANVLNIVSLISADFVKLVLMAIVIASPIAWYIMNQWLQGFAYRINIQWWVFAAGGGIAVLIAFVTVSFQSIKAASANPVKSLRNE